MIIRKLISRKLPVIYRWVRRRHYFPHAVLICCAILVLPVGVIGGVRLSKMVTTNQALAATRALAPEHSVLDQISERERKHYAAALKSLVVNDPDKMHQLIGKDFLVMLHEPDLKRSEGGTEAWQYRAGACLLDLYFESGEAGQGPVVHYEVRSPKVATFVTERGGEADIDATACLEALYKQRTI